MADKNGQNRGGKRTPAKPAIRSGIGKHSKRTDGRRQPVRTPGLDHPEIQYGDVQRLQQAQASQPLPIRQAPAGGPPAPVPPAGSAGGPLPLPDYFGESKYANEPVTEGLAMGPGAGPEVLSAPPDYDPEDIREVILHHFGYGESGYYNDEAKQMLEKIRMEKAGTMAGVGTPPSMPGQMPLRSASPPTAIDDPSMDPEGDELDASLYGDDPPEEARTEEMAPPGLAGPTGPTNSETIAQPPEGPQA